MKNEIHCCTCDKEISLYTPSTDDKFFNEVDFIFEVNNPGILIDFNDGKGMRPCCMDCLMKKIPLGDSE